MNYFNNRKGSHFLQVLGCEITSSSRFGPKEVDLQHFKKFFLSQDPNEISRLLKFTEKGLLSRLKCRWNTWRYLLGVIDITNPETILSSLQKSREDYLKASEKAQAVAQPKEANVVADPLSKGDSVRICPSRFIENICCRTLGTFTIRIMNYVH